MMGSGTFGREIIGATLSAGLADANHRPFWRHHRRSSAEEMSLMGREHYV